MQLKEGLGLITRLNETFWLLLSGLRTTFAHTRVTISFSECDKASPLNFNRKRPNLQNSQPSFRCGLTPRGRYPVKTTIQNQGANLRP